MNYINMFVLTSYVKMSFLPETYYLNRNADIIREFQKLTAGGKKVREAIKEIAEKFERVSESVVEGVIYTKGYPHASEAWQIVNKENEESSATRTVANKKEVA